MLVRQSFKFARKFTVLAFESSADDTCVAILNSDRQILSNVVIKQSTELEVNGGIHPRVAIEAHQRNLPKAVRRALDVSRVNVLTDIDGIAFTRGPGIGGCLSVSANAAKTLAAALGKPLVGVHHMQAHALTPLLTSDPASAPSFPYLSLLISGGHTILVLVRSPRDFELLTPPPVLTSKECGNNADIVMKDLSIGNAYDKVAKLLGIQPDGSGLGHGAALEQFCENNFMQEDTWKAVLKKAEDGSPGQTENSDRERRLTLVVPSPGQLRFSYAGLYSEIKQFIERQSLGNTPLPENFRIALAHAFQHIAAEQLEAKLTLALARCDNVSRGPDKVRDVVISGGVASNMFLRERINAFLHRWSEKNRVQEQVVLASYPPTHLCTDNAAMIGWASMYRFWANDTDPYEINLKPRWRIDEQ